MSYDFDLFVIGGGSGGLRLRAYDGVSRAAFNVGVNPGTGTGGMNSYALITAVFGSGTPDTTPPTVSITSPSNNASIMPGFAIAVQAADDVAISKVELRIDALREQVQAHGDDVDVAGALAIAEQGAFDPLGARHQRQLRRSGLRRTAEQVHRRFQSRSLLRQILLRGGHQLNTRSSRWIISSRPR